MDDSGWKSRKRRNVENGRGLLKAHHWSSAVVRVRLIRFTKDLQGQPCPLRDFLTTDWFLDVSLLRLESCEVCRSAPSRDGLASQLLPELMSPSNLEEQGTGDKGQGTGEGEGGKQ